MSDIVDFAVSGLVTSPVRFHLLSFTSLSRFWVRFGALGRFDVDSFQL